MLCPWPEQPSGIADSAFALAQGLARYTPCQLTVYTTNPSPVPLEGVDVRPHEEFLSSTEGHGLVLVHMGNNGMHTRYLEVLRRVSCVVHLHDLVLHHLMAEMTHGRGGEDEYLDLFERWYGRDLAVMNRILLEKGCGVWDTPAVIACPLFEPALQHARGCLVSSLFAQGRIQRAFPDLPVRMVPLINQVEDRINPLRDADNALAREDGNLHLGVFGFVQPNKRVDLVLQAIKNLGQAGERVRLHVVGGMTPGCQGLPRWVAENGLKSRVAFHGKVDNAQWLALMSRMDLVLALRHPTMGETSGVVADALSLGVPTVVNDTGSYAELPLFIPRIPVDDTVARLRDLLAALLADPATLATLRARVRELAKIRDYPSLSRRYYEALCHFQEA
jgi:glycosyltransferase involved in cell wall biosynthesis